MLALLIKPAAMRKSAHRRFIANLKNSGALQLASHTASELRSEISSLLEEHHELTVLACGGDGTVHLLLNSIVDLPVNFGVIPMGTGNDFARHLGIRNLTMAQEMIESQQFIQMDIGKIIFPDESIRYFAAVASCGVDAQVNEPANKISGPDGPIKYLAAVFGELKNLTSVRLQLTFNSQSQTGQYTLVAVGNTSSYGGGMKITPSADLQDGLFTLTIVDEASRRTLVKVLPTVFAGRHVFHPKVSVDQAKAISISGDAFPIYADGERIGIGPASFEVLPSRIRLLVPIANNL